MITRKAAAAKVRDAEISMNLGWANPVTGSAPHPAEVGAMPQVEYPWDALW